MSSDTSDNTRQQHLLKTYQPPSVENNTNTLPQTTLQQKQDATSSERSNNANLKLTTATTSMNQIPTVTASTTAQPTSNSSATAPSSSSLLATSSTNAPISLTTNPSNAASSLLSQRVQPNPTSLSGRNDKVEANKLSSSLPNSTNMQANLTLGTLSKDSSSNAISPNTSTLSTATSLAATSSTTTNSSSSNPLLNVSQCPTKSSTTITQHSPGNNVKNVSPRQQPTVPSLIIPASQQPASLNSNLDSANAAIATKKPTARARSSAKGTKKSKQGSANDTMANEIISKPEPKQKASRAKKNVSSNNDSSSGGRNPNSLTSKSESAKKGRSKTNKQANNSSSANTSGSSSSNTIEASPPLPKSQPVGPVKRKSRSTSNESANTAINTTTSNNTSSPVKRSRKKKSDQNTAQAPTEQQLHHHQQSIVTTTNISSNIPPPPHQPLSGLQSQFLTSGALPQNHNAPIGTSPLMINTPIPNSRFLQGANSLENHDTGNRYFSPMISPYANYDHLNASSLSRASLSRLFTSSSVENSNNLINSNSSISNNNNIINNTNNMVDDPAKAFEELRENVWTHLSKCVLEQAQQFDIPSLIGTLYTLRTENDKLVNRVRDLSMKRDQLIAINARLDLPGPMLTQHLNNTSPNFSSVVSGLTNSPRSLPTSSPGSAIGNKQQQQQQAPPQTQNPLPPLVSVSSHNHISMPGNNPLGPTGYGLDRSSPLVSQTHSGINNIKSSSISTPSPPIGALMAHNTSNRAGLIAVNQPFMPSVYPQINTLAQIGSNPQSSSYYPRQ